MVVIKRIVKYSCIFLLMIMAVYLSGCANNQPEENTNPIYVPDFTAPLYFEGKVISRDSFEISFSRPGIIEKLNVKLGDIVEKGDILAVLDTKNSLAEIQLAEAALSLAEANLQVVMEKSLNPNSGEIAVAQAQVDQAEISLEIAKLNLEETKLISPIDGTITHIYSHQYEYAFAGQPALQLKDAESLSVELQMDAFDLADVSTGDKATVSFENLPNIEVEGIVASILPDEEIQRGGQFIVIIDIIQNEEEIKWGLSANVLFVDQADPETP